MKIEEMEPLITVGAAFALSVAGYFMSNRQPKLTNSIPSTSSESDSSNLAESSTPSSSVGLGQCLGSSPAESGTSTGEFMRGLRIIGNDDAHVNVIQRGSVAPQPPRLPPLHEEQEETVSNEPNQPRLVIENEEPNTEPPTQTEAEQDKINISEKEEEIKELRELVQTLLDKEQNRDIQMLEYYGLKEQEEAMREMANELKVNSAETKLLAHKVESLEEENERLKRQIMEMEKMKNKLDSNKDKITMLKKSETKEDENAQEKILLLRHRIEALAEKNNRSAAVYEEIENKVTRVKELEEEVNELRKINSRLEEENYGLTQQMENTELVVSSASRVFEEQVLEEATRLREANEKLEKEMDQLRDDHSSMAEEIVYLKWINACVRHEVENFHNPSKILSIACHLNTSPSHNSKEIIKQLILEYKNHGSDITYENFLNFDFDVSGSHISTPNTPTHETDKSTSKGKHKKGNKFLNSIKNIVAGHKHSSSHKDKTPSPISENASPFYSNDSSPLSSTSTIEPITNFPWSENHPKASLNTARPGMIESEYARSRSDIGSHFLGKEVTKYRSLNLDHPSSDFHEFRNKEISNLSNALMSSNSSPLH